MARRFRHDWLIGLIQQQMLCPARHVSGFPFSYVVMHRLVVAQDSTTCVDVLHGFSATWVSLAALR
jgi:hypothetical protein